METERDSGEFRRSSRSPPSTPSAKEDKKTSMLKNVRTALFGRRSTSSSSPRLAMKDPGLRSPSEDDESDDAFKVMVNDEVFYVERTPSKDSENNNIHHDSFDVDDDVDDDDGELLTLEDMLASIGKAQGMQNQNQRLRLSSTSERKDDDTVSPSFYSPSVSSRKMIKSLPRVFTSPLAALHNELLQQRAPVEASVTSRRSVGKPSSKEDLAASPVDILKQRTLLKDISRRFKNSKERLNQIPKTDEMIQLEKALQDKSFKSRITDSLVGETTVDLLVKMHFCCAVLEYESLPEGKSKRSKGQKIIRLFIQKDSMFRLQGVPPSYESHLLLTRHYEYLEYLRLVCLEELATSDAVLRVLFGSKRNVLSH